MILGNLPTAEPDIFDLDASRAEISTFVNARLPMGEPDNADLLLVSTDPTDPRRAPPPKAHWCKSIEELIEVAARAAEKRRIYMPIGYQSRKLATEKSRYAIGTEDKVQGVSGIGIDIDFAAPGHAADNNLTYPPDLAAVTSVIEGIQLKPSGIVHTGGGIQAWWLYDEYVDVTDEQTFRRAKAAQVAVFETVNLHFAERGYKIDAGSKQLNKLLRVPGGRRLKGDDRRMIFAKYTQGPQRYSLSDIEELANPDAVRIASRYASPASKGPSDPTANDEQGAEPYRRLAEIALAQIDKYASERVNEYETWIRYGLAIKRIGGNDDRNFEVFDTWSKRSGKYDQDDTAKRWGSFAPQRVSILSIVSDAEKLSPSGDLEALQRPDPETPRASNWCDGTWALRGLNR